MKKSNILLFAFCASVFVLNTNAPLLAQTRIHTQAVAGPGEGDDGGDCDNIKSGSIKFDPLSTKITPDMQAMLANLAAQMQYSPSCKVVVLGSAGGSKVAEMRANDRTAAVIEYMGEKFNIDRNRFAATFDSRQSDDNTVVFRVATAGE